MLLQLRKNLKSVYDRSIPPRVYRTPVPEDKIPWTVPFPEYSPTNFTVQHVLNCPPWADKELGSDAVFQWNQLDGVINRVSYEGSYEISDSGFPLNPSGRTGLSGRGYLGKWGCNHAVDCLITRLKPGQESILPRSYQFIGIQRRDTGEWAIPGGMIDAGEDVETALKREFMEEVLDSEQMSPDEAARVLEMLTQMFKAQEAMKTVVYKGYVDDPRNTDNAWMETTCVNVQCTTELQEFLRPEKLKAGSDAASVRWIDIDSGLKLYASHELLIRKFLETVQQP